MLAFPSRWAFPLLLLRLVPSCRWVYSAWSWAGGQHRQQAGPCSGNVLLVLPIPYWKVSVVTPKRPWLPSWVHSLLQPPLLAHFMGVRDRDKKWVKRVEKERSVYIQYEESWKMRLKISLLLFLVLLWDGLRWMQITGTGVNVGHSVNIGGEERGP